MVAPRSSRDYAQHDVQSSRGRTDAGKKNRPRPEDVVLGRPPRGGLPRRVAPFGGGEVSRPPFPTVRATSARPRPPDPPTCVSAAGASQPPDRPDGPSSSPESGFKRKGG